jgi:hypothetical protein
MSNHMEDISLPSLPETAVRRTAIYGGSSQETPLKFAPHKHIRLTWTNGNQLRGHLTLQNAHLADGICVAFQFRWKGDDVFVYPASGILQPGQKTKVIRKLSFECLHWC